MEAPSAVYARARGGLIEGFLRRPLGNRVIALAAFIQADVNRLHGVEHFRATLGQQVHEPRRDPGRDDSRAVLLLEALVEIKLLRLEWLLCQPRCQVYIMRAQSQRRAQDDLVEYSRPGIHQQGVAPCRANNGPQIPGVDLLHRDVALLPEEAPRALHVPVSASNNVTLTGKQMGEQRASSSGSEDEDPHPSATLACGCMRLNYFEDLNFATSNAQRVAGNFRSLAVTINRLWRACPARKTAGRHSTLKALYLVRRGMPSTGRTRSEERRVGKECRSRWSP